MIPSAYLLLAKIGAITALLLAVFFYGHHVGENSVQAAWDASKVHLLMAQEKLTADHEKIIVDLKARQDADARKVSDDHERALNALQQKYVNDVTAIRAAGGLRVSRSICSGSAGTTTEATSNSGHNDYTTGTIALPEQTSNDLLELAAEADRVTEVARSCQAWIRLNGFYGPVTSGE